MVLFVVIPLSAGILTRTWVLKHRGEEYLNTRFIPKFSGVTTVGLLLTLIILFSFQGNTILQNPLHIALIAVPLILQTFLVFFIAYLASKLLKLPHNIAAPAGMKDHSVLLSALLYSQSPSAFSINTAPILVEAIFFTCCNISCAE